MSVNTVRLHARLLGGAAVLALMSAGIAHAEAATFSIPAQSLSMAVNAFSEQSGRAVLLKPELADAIATKGVSGSLEPEIALAEMLSGTGLTFRQTGDTFLIVSASGPQSGSAAGDGAEGTVEALIVTAQKREENIQDVPIAISAFSQKALDEQKIEGGFDLLKAIPNVTFSKNNFSGYNFSIRGIGTKAVSVTTDPGVAVEFNGTPLIRNRLFEQEYFDVQRVEVLRGPQGTLHGRNATAGVINVISSVANTQEFAGSLKGEVGNYHTKRLSGFVNVPIIEDVLAVRLAGALTDRQGYDYNARTKHAINGRDLWSGRLSVGYEPNERIRADLIWERFNEDDDRSRTGKQLCHHDAGEDRFLDPNNFDLFTKAAFSQGCKPGSLYDDNAFGTPNGLSLPFILSAGYTGTGAAYLGYDDEFNLVPIIDPTDPYGNMMQSRDLRVIDSILDPVYQAKTDVLELNMSIDVSPSLTLTSQTAYTKDKLYSFQDYNRFNTVPIFNDPSGLTSRSAFSDVLKGGIYCDPQIGCSNSIAGFDISRAKSQQFSQELRLQSNFEGAFNFSVGANYTRYRTIEDYYVFFNIISLLAQSNFGLGIFNDSTDVTKCLEKNQFLFEGKISGFPIFGGEMVNLDDPRGAGCVYIDPNPIESIDGEGHNYFRSKNPYTLKSTAAFGEVYWQATDSIKVTAGLRYTDDRKKFTPVPTQILLANSILSQGTADKGYPERPVISQHWGELSGRIGADWKPDLAFTDNTLLYAFYSRGYKGGGANPPGIGFDTAPCPSGSGVGTIDGKPCAIILPYPLTFEPEFVHAFEVGAKNTLMGGGLVLNMGAFFYDYSDYQISQIKERTAVNENFDAKVWGLEVESVFIPSRDLRFNFTFGYQDTQVADGELSLDLMNRTQGVPGYYVIKGGLQLASNCVAPEAFIIEVLQQGSPAAICPGNPLARVLGVEFDYSSLPNGGAGFFDELGGNELPNAPHWTTSLGTQYSRDLLDGSWRATVRTDAYWQSQSWARIYNLDPYDKLHGWYNLNLSVWFERPDDDLKIELYAKNILDETPITDAFLNSDDTALTTNVFVLDPRLIGLSIRKGF